MGLALNQIDFPSASGILGLITEFAASDDVRVSFPARKTLHNLDRDNSKYTLPPGIYQVYPDFRTSEDERKIDIVFVHGIMGGAFRTWRSQDLNAGASSYHTFFY